MRLKNQTLIIKSDNHTKLALCFTSLIQSDIDVIEQYLAYDT